MVINLWYSPSMKNWRWSLTNVDNLDQYSGQNKNLDLAMEEIANTAKKLMIHNT